MDVFTVSLDDLMHLIKRSLEIGKFDNARNVLEDAIKQLIARRGVKQP